MPKSQYVDPGKVFEPGYIDFDSIPLCRYNKTIERYTKYCKDGKIDIEAVKSIFEAVHSESIRQQLRVVNEDNE